MDLVGVRDGVATTAYIREEALRAERRASRAATPWSRVRSAQETTTRGNHRQTSQSKPGRRVALPAAVWSELRTQPVRLPRHNRIMAGRDQRLQDLQR